ncbi:MAG: hypothetical protein KAS38_16550, partial [Anaerolineales bacterium]|nr:hypothetical protein [Anaerolineales bacterium]
MSEENQITPEEQEGQGEQEEQKSRTWLIIAIVVAAILVLALGYLALRPQEAEGYTVGLSLSTLNNPFFVTLKEGAEAAAQEAGVELIVVDAQDDPAKEATNIE